MTFGVGSWVLTGCDSGSKGVPKKKAPPSEKTEPPAAAPEKKPAAAPSPGGGKAEVVLEVGDQIVYSQTKIEVATGATVELTIKHTGKLPKAAMGHNFVLLAQGTDMNQFAMTAMAAAATEYIPANMKDKVIAHTKVVGGGESDTITFTAPAPGEYAYLCTFPGHWQQMNGKLIVS